MGVVTFTGTRLCSLQLTMVELLVESTLQRKIVRSIGQAGGGCISNGSSYELDDGKKIFVKYNEDYKAKVMFDGERESLQSIYNTRALRVPQPVKVVEGPSGRGWVFIMEYIQMLPLNRYMRQLGEQLARLHLHNISLRTAGDEATPMYSDGYVDRFGFSSTTCCGFIPQNNEWACTWVEFYTRQRLQPQVDLIVNKYGDREVQELWSQLQKKIPLYFEGVDVYPSLLHGDLWSGNVAETDNEAVSYDPASFYGHHEYDLAITNMFGGFNKAFYSGYHSLIPKAHGFESRQKLYCLFHYLNHWNHFGSGYRQQSLGLLRELI